VNTLGRFSFLTLLLAYAAIFSEPASAQKSTLQHFICAAGYTPAECHTQVLVLRAALDRYPTRELGDWTWVVVRSYDWLRFLSDRKLAPDIPAFTYLAKRSTYFDEALLETASSRGVELALSWHMTVPQLLDLAIRHEMGHALCKERSEDAANRTAQLLLDSPTLDTFRACIPKKPEKTSPSP
jgi:hypothetical protein